jgi:surface protein
VGGKGTAYDAAHVDADYAHVDGGADNPGYLSAGTMSYVCYTPENTMLTFYCDDQRDSREGTIIYDLNEGIIPPGWVNDNTYQQVTQAVFDPSFADARPTTTCAWFDGMNSLQSITGLNYLNTSEVTTMIRMFGNCSELTSIDVSNFNTDKVEYMAGMFNSCTKITSLDLYSFNTSNVTNMLEMFNGCSSLQTINVSDGWSTAALSEDYLMFMDCSSLVGGEGTAYDANHVTASYAHIDGGADNPGYLTDPYARKAYVVFTAEDETLTFYYDHLRGTRSGTIYNLNTGRNNPDWYDDQTCMQVKYAVIDPSFADARPTTTYSWFLDMELLESITGLEYLNTSDVTNMEYMFSACNELTSLDLSHFNTEEVTFMGGMFIHCNKIKSLDLRSFNTAKVRGMRNLFALCHALKTIYVGDGWSTASVSDDFQMFMECNSLVGGMGTTFDPAHIRSEYAHIDGGPDNPGYFTAKNAGLRGDVNGDGIVNIADVSDLVDYLLSGETIPECADCDQNGVVGIADVSVLVDYILSGTWSVVEP